MSTFPELSPSQWNSRTAAHLMARAGFGALPSERTVLASKTPQDVVDALLAYDGATTTNQTPDWYKEADADLRLPGRFPPGALQKLPDPERREARKKEQTRNREQLNASRNWWFHRLMTTQHPLEEKLTLFLHGHFASSFRKVRSSYAMLHQNLTLREQGLGRWGDLVESISKDPAMLVYLDNEKSNRKKPNENYARELLELFTLGEGNYGEADILAAARAFTGWSIDPRQWHFLQRVHAHDSGSKVFLGEEGLWQGEDVIRIILKQDRAAEHLVTELWTYFAYANPEPELVNRFSAFLRQEDYRIAPLLRAMFLHPSFYSERAFRTQIKSPVVWSIHLFRMLEGSTLPPGLKVHQICQNLGQSLFDPPSVKGWDGGSSWITASTLALRYQGAEQVIGGYGFSAKGKKEKPTFFEKEKILPDSSLSRIEARELLFDRFYHDPLRKEDREAMDAWMHQKVPAPSDWKPYHWKTVLLRILQTPQFQLT